ncbi:hypothetical protein [Bifidobacterium castoris]|uniref:Thymidine phosphorylase n=1 Tax=Bifidobacterium castoris TaxID=2306972 RepID=A0A430F904_9BIFI|nr:hypothetical protein [Bifidobacterium castoris]RSX49298.1 thymidine phosphorylase [Bifidobacterium castoris]
MSTNAQRSGSGSIIASRSAFTHTGSPRPPRPGQLDQALAENIAGGADPEQLSAVSHATAWALLSHVHKTDDPQVVDRVLTLVDHEGVDVIAELWSHAEPDSLPGVLWRLYLLRTWMRRHRDSIARLWRLGEPIVTSASAIAGVDAAPTEEDIARTADSILAGAFRGDFAVALDRAATFVEVVVAGLRVQAKRLNAHARAMADVGSPAVGTTEDIRAAHTKAAQLLHTAANLHTTAADLRTGAHLWRRGRLE